MCKLQVLADKIIGRQAVFSKVREFGFAVALSITAIIIEEDSRTVLNEMLGYKQSVENIACIAVVDNNDMIAAGGTQDP